MANLFTAGFRSLSGIVQHFDADIIAKYNLKKPMTWCSAGLWHWFLCCPDILGRARDQPHTLSGTKWSFSAIKRAQLCRNSLENILFGMTAGRTVLKPEN